MPQPQRRLGMHCGSLQFFPRWVTVDALYFFHHQIPLFDGEMKLSGFHETLAGVLVHLVYICKAEAKDPEF